MLSINRTEYFEIAHNLFPYDGKCYSLHGHSYKVNVEITGPQTVPLDMIIDFNILKQVMKDVIPDHAYIYDTNLLESHEVNNIIPELVPLLEKNNMKTVGYPCPTTCENLVQLWADAINKELAEKYELYDVYVNKLTANETQNSQAVYVANDNYNPYGEAYKNFELAEDDPYGAVQMGDASEMFPDVYGNNSTGTDEPTMTVFNSDTGTQETFTMEEWNKLMNETGGLDKMGLEVE